MKTTAEKSSTTTSSTVAQMAHRPFIERAGHGTFFEAARDNAPAGVQFKMTVNQPGDKLEQEAQKTADTVMRMLAPPVQGKLERQLEEKMHNREEEKILKAPQPEEKIQKAEDNRPQKAPAGEKPYPREEEKIMKAGAPEEKRHKHGDEKAQLAAEGGAAPAVGGDVHSAIRARTTGGEPLSADVRSYMEARFNADFNNVRIHTDSESGALSNQLSARAFTYQNHIFFSRDQYQPGTSEGKQLLAHELTHTMQQGAVARRTSEVSRTQTPVVQRAAVDWIKEKIIKGLDWLANRILPGYTLLNVILGKNVLTAEPVSRTGVSIIKGYMRLSPVTGSILLSELEETDSLTQAGAWVEAQVARFGINFNDLATRLELMWEEMSMWRGMDYNVEIFKKYLSPVLGVFLAFSAVVEGKVKELRFEGALRLVGATQLLGAMKKDPGAFKRLVDDPKLILKYFMDALKTGFSHFKDNFGTHFKNAIFGWLFGKAAEMGIQMPKEFNVAGLFHLIAQLIGVTYRQIRSQVVAHLGPKGESIVSTMEKAVDILKDLITRGPIALWEHVKSFLSDLKEMIFSKISELVTVEIIKAAVLKLISMLNPVGAIVQLVLGIYRVVKFFIDRWDTIKQLTNAILDSITNVALGNIGAAADYIEQTMAKGITLIISFLAGILGLGGIVEKVKSLIKKISDPVQAAIAKVVNWILEKGKALLAKLFLEVKAGVSKLPAWWKKKVPIVGDDEPHTLYFKGEEDAAELMVASSPRRLENFVSDARANSEITGNAKKNAALDKVEAEIPVLRKIRAALRPLKDAPEDKRKPHLDKLDASFGKIGTELEIILAGSKSGTEAAPILIPWPKPAYTAYPQLSLYNQGSKDKPKWKLSAKKKPGTPAATYSPDGGHSAAAGTPGELQTLGIKPPFQLTPGMTIGPLSDASTPGGGKINSILERYGWDATGEYMDGDHVVEIQFGGKDRLANLWPLDASVNRGAGSKLSRQQVDLDGQKITIDWLKKAKKKPGKETKKYYFKVSGVV